MELIVTEEMVLEDLMATCTRIFGFNVRQITPIKRGWLNLKWKVETDAGNYLIKQYHKERYKKYKHVELLQAFAEQSRLYEQGFPTAKLLTHEGQFFLKSDNGELFMVMEFCKGNLIPPGQMNAAQMHDLGRVTGQLHQLCNDGSLEKKKHPEFRAPSIEERLVYWNDERQKIMNRISQLGVDREAEAIIHVEKQKKLLAIIDKQCEVSERVHLEDFNLEVTGWAHRDLWMDNLLFLGDRVNAVLDFDRMNYDYPQLDVARAIISGALSDQGLDASLVRAFHAGYSEHQRLEEGFVSKALKLLWYMESTWWIHGNMDQQSGPSARFAEEMVWLGDHYFELDALLEDL